MRQGHHPNSRTLLPDEPDFMDDHFHGLGKPPYSEQRGETGSGGVAGTIKAIVTGGAISRRDRREHRRRTGLDRAGNDGFRSTHAPG
jgi:hypothetical protein